MTWLLKDDDETAIIQQLRAHNGDPLNELADRIANDEAARVLQFVNPSANPITVGIN